MGKSILGTRDSITEASRDALIAYYRNHYLREKLVIVAAGNVDHDYLIDKFALKFSALAGSNPTNLKPELTPAATVKQRLLQAKPLEQTHICNGGAIQFSRFSEDAESLRFLDTLVGGGMSSRLFQELREIRGLVYHVYSDYSLYRDSGEYAIYAACSHQDYPLVLATITQELDKLTKQAILEPELKRIKGQLKGNLVLSLESTMNRMLKLAKDEYNYGRIVSVDETLTEIDAITADQILDHAKNIFKYEDWNLVVLGLA